LTQYLIFLSEQTFQRQQIKMYIYIYICGSSRIACFNPYMEDGLIRLGGRLQFSRLTANEESSPEAELLETEMSTVSSWLALYKKVLTYKNFRSDGCPTMVAQHLRQVSWYPLLGNKHIEGVTIPHPTHQFVHTWGSTALHSKCRGAAEYIEFHVLKVDDPSQLIQTRGPYPAFIGSVTREKGWCCCDELRQWLD
jgi:hypothetical protein